MKLTLDKRGGLGPKGPEASKRPSVSGRAGFFLLGMACTALLQAWAPVLSGFSSGGLSMRQYHPRAGEPAAQKPWGDFEYVSVPLQEPNELLPDSSRALGSPRWYFGNCSRAQLTVLIQSLDVNAEYRQAMLVPSRWQQSGSGFYVTPPMEMILRMSPTTRSRVYALLGHYPENSAQCNPFRFPLNGFNQSFADSGLGATQLEILHSLLYTNARTLCFCDGAILQRLFSTNDFKSLVQTLYGENTFLMKLRVRPDTDVEAIVKYWAKGGRAAAMRPLLEALTKVPGGGLLNVSYLLPPFARLRLYTYAKPATEPTATRQNCFWTALNFFNEKPDPQFVSAERARGVLEADYFKTEQSAIYGDVIALVDAEDKVVHMCVYLADDVVFTKNGIDDMQPWVLMKVADMMRYYVAWTPVQMRVYRSRKS